MTGMHRKASMEPRPYGRGDCAARAATNAAKTRGFNGATAIRPWRPGGRLRPADDLAAASMEPRPYGRGDVGSRRNTPPAMARASMEPRPYGRGDVAMPAWRLCIRDSLQWSHGHTAVETRRPVGRHRIRMRSFNGATAIRPWRPAPRPHAAVGGRLQWSHGHTAVETEDA